MEGKYLLLLPFHLPVHRQLSIFITPGCLTVCPLGMLLQMQEYLLLQKPHLKFFLLVLSQSINFLCEGWDV